MAGAENDETKGALLDRFFGTAAFKRSFLIWLLKTSEVSWGDVPDAALRPQRRAASARAKRPPWGRPLRCGAGGGKGEKSLQRAARVWRKGLAGAPATPAHLSSLRAAARARAKGQTDMFLFPML